jgi:hypothetical protein
MSIVRKTVVALLGAAGFVCIGLSGRALAW